MKILKIIGIIFFFIHYYLMIAYAFFKNCITFLWRVITQSSTQKHHISPFKSTHSLVFANISEVIMHEGFEIDTHKFQTEDGAEVSVWRLKKVNAELNKPYPVLMMHGLLDCSASWFLHVDKSKSLPYILAGEGYDVWVGNNRGNRLSRDEDDDCQRYWAYNFDHLVEYDQPVVINGVLRETAKQKIIYIGHSQGSTQFLLGLGVHSHLQEKIAAFIGLGTVVSLENVNNHVVLKALSRLYLLQLCRMLGFNKILVLPKVLSRAVGVLLYNSGVHTSLMMGFIRLLCGFSVRNKIPADLFGVIITHEPGGSSVNNALHWVQCYRQGGVMKRFNFGKNKNLKQYGMQQPPAYCLNHLKKLPFNTYLFRGLKDAVMNEVDFNRLVDKFGEDRISTYEIPDYNHLDYVWSESAHHDIYGLISEIVERGSI